MANIQKFKATDVVTILRHNAREIQNPSNPDIDSSRSHLNYAVGPQWDKPAYEIYRDRLKELYVYGRRDVVTMVGVVVSAPKELQTDAERREFFEATYDFLIGRYGEKNAVQAIVHCDEGKSVFVRSEDGSKVSDKDGNPMRELKLGAPHLHFNFIPAVQDSNPRHSQCEKVCANDLLTRSEFQRFHTDFQRYLDARGIRANVHNGVTKGRNLTIEQLKERTDMQHEIEKLQRQVQTLKCENDRLQNVERSRTHGFTW